MELKKSERQKRLQGRMITVGVCACSAIPELFAMLQALRREGASVEIIMTPSATKLISPLMMQRESDKPVLVEQFELPKVFDKDHRRQADIMLIAPASANTVSKIALGICDNLLTTRVMSARCPVAVVLYCNPAMYEKKSLQRNIAQMKEDGFIFLQEADHPSRFPSTEMLVDEIIGIINASDDAKAAK
ncbi:MAG: flavoprotein [Oscillospiraceae bacterium]|nr:flavoprotein [Oscillospiraceae bacterium]